MEWGPCIDHRQREMGCRIHSINQSPAVTPQMIRPFIFRRFVPPPSNPYHIISTHMQIHTTPSARTTRSLSLSLFLLYFRLNEHPSVNRAFPPVG